MTPERIKHFEVIQAVITRLAGNSFSIKGWTVVLVAALLAVAVKEQAAAFAATALLPIVFFWGLDAYYLLQERLFRDLYRRLVAQHSLSEGLVAGQASPNSVGGAPTPEVPPATQTAENIPLFDMTVGTLPIHESLLRWLRALCSRPVVAFYIGLATATGMLGPLIRSSNEISLDKGVSDTEGTVQLLLAERGRIESLAEAQTKLTNALSELAKTLERVGNISSPGETQPGRTAPKRSKSAPTR
jgi:hypothetical protein